MGTQLYGRGVFVNVCYDEVTLSRPDLVRQIHRDYVDAGAEIVETNTFGANPVKLSAYGLAERTEELNRAAARLAREAVGTRASVAGAIGPLGIRIEPYGPTSRDEATAHFRRQVLGLLEGGVEGFVLETFSDLAEIECAYRAVRAETDLPVVAQMTVGPDGKTAYGTDPAHLARALTDLGADVIGLNCSVGPAVMLDAIEEMAEATTAPLSAQPNAGVPRTVCDRQIYLASPEYVAEYARRMIQDGVRFLGGCCGTTPAHIRAIRDVVGEAAGRPATTRVSVPRAVEKRAAVEPVPLRDRSKLGAKLADGRLVLSVEIRPPHGWNAAEVAEPARALAAAGVDVVTLVDTARSRIRMGSLAAATLVQHEAGIEAVVHYTCRGKNMLTMLSDLLGAAALGLRNVLVVSGDPPALGPYPDATEVFDIDSIGLTHLVQGLNRGVDPGGATIGAPTQFVQGVQVSEGAQDRALELERFAYKLEAGADFAVTQPVFDVADLEPFLELAARHRTPVIAGILPFPSLRTAEFFANEVPGISVPANVVERMRRAEASGPEAAGEEGVRIALEVIAAARPLVQGFHLGAPRRNVEVALRVLREAGLG
ncbi:MAG: bifunctional homocysteine S-methyltransferase/methylenetetrahydrofolate reductase [Gemmatimonadetes bacterium]|nr:bifunctional homocysteine S-methyltransferase/methylenetetrahydrofolate reductase [Gemmatimonadota bacterium]